MLASSITFVNYIYMDNIWHELIYPALKSPATTTLVAILAATGAFLIYFLRRRDNKRDSANIIVLEIKNAERNLAEARKTYEEAKAKNGAEAIAFPEKLRLMSTESWTKYKYLFVRDFTPEQWDELSQFYENCKNFDEAVELKESSFKGDVIEIRASINRIVGDYAKEFADKVKLNPSEDPDIERSNQQIMEEHIERKNIAVEAILRKLVESYSPDKHYNEAAYYYNLLPRSIINTPTGQRLLELSNKKILPLWVRKK